jgi:hypothetical protein
MWAYRIRNLRPNRERKSPDRGRLREYLRNGRN